MTAPMLRRAAPLALALVLAAPAGAAAQPEDDGAWHADGYFGAVVPLATSDYTNVTGFGGRVGGRAYRAPFEAALELGLFAAERPIDSSEMLVYRLRALAGYRHHRQLTTQRTVVLRALGGVELAGFDDIGTTDYLAERYGPGFAIEVGAESRSALSWGGVVSLTLGLGVSAQPFGDTGAGEARYVGVELLAGAAIGI